MTTENPLDSVVQLARVEALDNLYFMDGRDDPTHEYHHTYTGLYQKYLAKSDES